MNASSQLTRFAAVGAPALLGAYGVVRLLDGQHGPGAGWTTGHLLLLAGLLLFAPVFPGLRRLGAARGRGGRVAASVAFGTALVGLAGSLGQVAIDLYVGSRAADLADQNRMFGEIQSHPGVVPLFYSVVPLFFYLGLLALAIVPAVGKARRISAWSPVLVFTGTVVMSANLDLLPVGAVLFLAALAPLPAAV